MRAVRRCLLPAACLFFISPGAFSAAQERPEDPHPKDIPIGLLIPTEGPEAETGASVQKALEAYFSNLPSSSSARFRLRLIPAEKRWGRQTEEIVRSIYDDGTRVIIGGMDERSAHLAAQIISRSKGAALLISLAPDPTLTQSGVPWVFRLISSPAEASPAGPEDLALRAASGIVRAYESGVTSVEGIGRFLALEPGFDTARPLRNQGQAHISIVNP